MMLNKVMKLYKEHEEIARYLFFGIATTLVNWVVYTIAMNVNDSSMAVCNALAWMVAVVFAFVTNKIWVFGSKEWDISLVIKELFMFVGARIVTGVFEIAGPSVLYAIGLSYALFGIKGFGAKVVMSVIVIVLNYLFSKLLVFKKRT